ncbi:MAG TPA: type II secretion system F family protein, partial [Chthoniobacteraceae bacterium]|nr:type II secretion system F family protein [Chthoniobacteraceae bacterium]
LPMALEKAGARYDKELNAAISALTSMIQPAVIVVVAGIVGVVAYSMMGGIFQAVSGLRSP